VRWRTSVDTDSEVRCGSAPGSLVVCGQDLAGTSEHVLTLTGLTPDTRYYYSVGSTSQVLAGDDPNHFFVTSPLRGTPKPTRIWVLGDSGTGDANAMAVRDAYYTLTGTVHTDLWLMLGDNAYYDGTDQEYQDKLFEIFPDMLIKSVLWPTLGNHDAVSSDSPSQSGPYYDSFSLPTMGEAGGAASGTEAYYSFDHANVHFVVLDSHDTDRTPASAMWTWLASDLSSTAQDWIIAYWHHPPYSKGGHDSDTEGRMVDMRENALPILEDHGVDLVMTGHSHSYERSYLIDGSYDTPTPDFATLLAAGKIVDPGDGIEGSSGPYLKPNLGPDPRQGAVYVVAGSSGLTTSGPFGHPVVFTHHLTLGSLVLDVGGPRLDARFLDSTGAILDHVTIIKGPITSPPSANFTNDPASGGVPLSVDFTDLSQNDPTGWDWDFDNDGSVDSNAQNPSFMYSQAGLYSVKLSVTNPLGSDELTKIDQVCVVDGAPGEIVNLAFQTSEQLSWDALPLAITYDIVKGDLGQLRASGGNFSVAQLECLEDDGGDTEATDPGSPPAGQGYVYVVRAADCANRAGTFDTSGTGQVGTRDPELQGFGSACSCAPADDNDGDGYCNLYDNCPEVASANLNDGDGDGLGDICDGCPADGNKTAPGACGCGTADTDTDLDSVADCNDADDDNDGIGDGTDPSPLDPDVCGDRDSDGCDDCSIGTDNFGPLSDSDPANDGPDSDGDGLCDCGTQTAQSFVLSTTVDATLGGLPFRENDLAEYDSGTDTAILFFDGDLITSGAADIDAVSLLSNGHIVLSTENSETLGDLSVRDGDLVDYDPGTNKATLFFNEDLFATDADIDAVAVLTNGHIVLSTVVNETLGGLAFRAHDLVEYDPVTDTATLLFDGDLISSGLSDIDGVSVLSNGHIVLSTENSETLAGLTFRDGDLVEYDQGTSTATLFFDEDLFTAGAADIDAVSVRREPQCSASIPDDFSALDLANWTVDSGVW